MRMLPYVNLSDIYGSHKMSTKDNDFNVNRCISAELLGFLKLDITPRNLVETVSAITRVYLDGLIHEKDTKYFEWDTQKEVLHDLFLAGKKAVGSFYRGEEMDFENIGEMILQHNENINRYGGKNKARSQRIREYGTIQNFGLALQYKLDELNPDVLAYVASGGLEPALLIMDILDADTLLPLRFSWNTHKDIEVKYPMPEKDVLSGIARMRVLVVEDIINTLGSIVNTMNFAADNGASKVFGTPVCAEPNIAYEIEYCGTDRISTDIKVIPNHKPYIFEHVCPKKRGILSELPAREVHSGSLELLFQ